MLLVEYKYLLFSFFYLVPFGPQTSSQCSLCISSWRSFAIMLKSAQYYFCSHKCEMEAQRGMEP